ncbi:MULTISPECIES: VOC family protein [Micrococcaceae]|uniref:VOC family protein n=1 Tax=Micrococcaceae TaxID=1268 RepID=UPI0032B4F0E5
MSGGIPPGPVDMSVADRARPCRWWRAEWLTLQLLSVDAVRVRSTEHKGAATMGGTAGNFQATEPADNRTWPGAIGAITLFVEDLPVAKRFYREVFGLPVAYEDEASAVFRFENTLINLLNSSEAPELIGPAKVASAEVGARMQFTLEVDDVDALCADLTGRGVELLNGPVNRPWGIRTASFRDPGGHIWEIAAALA